jgi:NAD+ kinase
MRKINRIKICHNENSRTTKVLGELKTILEDNNFTIVDNDADLVIAIGGDGSFLRMIKNENYNSDLIYVGINAGTLGFLQEIKIDDIDNFVECLNNNNYRIDEVGVQKTTIHAKDGDKVFYSLNEIVIRESELNTVFLSVSVNDKVLEKYVGDGLLIATSVGSTAYNLSFGGSIVYNSLHTLQITPIAPLNNKAYRNLHNSIVVPEKAPIKIEPINNKDSLLLSIDGENKKIDNIEYIDTKVDDKHLRFLRLEDYCFWEKINDKFLSN